MGSRVRLCSAVSDDLAGRTALEALSAAGMSTAGVKTLSDSSVRTAQYVAVNDGSRDLMVAMADMTILESTSADPGSVSEALDAFWLPQLQDSKPSHLVLDANWPPQHLARWLEAAKAVNAHVTFEPVSLPKSTRLFNLAQPHKLSVLEYSSRSLHPLSWWIKVHRSRVYNYYLSSLQYAQSWARRGCCLRSSCLPTIHV